MNHFHQRFRDDLSSFVSRADRFILADQYPDAVEELEHAITLYPQESELRRKLAAVYLALRQPDKALESAREAVALNPNNDKALEQTALALIRQYRLSDALACLEAALEALPIEPHYYYLKAFCLHYLNKQEEALEAISRAIALNPAYLAYRRFRDEINDPDSKNLATGPEYAALVPRDPDFVLSYSQFARKLILQGRFFTAASSYWQAVQDDPMQTDYKNRLFRLLNSVFMLNPLRKKKSVLSQFHDDIARFYTQHRTTLSLWARTRYCYRYFIVSLLAALVLFYKFPSVYTLLGTGIVMSGIYLYFSLHILSLRRHERLHLHAAPARTGTNILPPLLRSTGHLALFFFAVLLLFVLFRVSHGLLITTAAATLLMTLLYASLWPVVVYAHRRDKERYHTRARRAGGGALAVLILFVLLLEQVSGQRLPLQVETLLLSGGLLLASVYFYLGPGISRYQAHNLAVYFCPGILGATAWRIIRRQLAALFFLSLSGLFFLAGIVGIVTTGM